MKRKETAGILALFLGWAGIHRFYLGQVGLGILYALLMFSGISMVLGIIDAIVFLSMDQDTFDIKYNRDYYRAVRKEHNQQDLFKPYWHEPQRPRERPDYTPQQRKPEARVRPKKANPHKAEGIRKFKDYDYDGAVVEFEKALEIEPRDIATHFNLACAYSINERPDKAFEMLDKAVALGFDDFDRIRTHESLAYLRIQPEYDTFEAKGFRTTETNPFGEEEKKESPEKEEEEDDNLLEQLKKLAELKEKGLLSEEEFDAQKKKLLR